VLNLAVVVKGLRKRAKQVSTYNRVDNVDKSLETKHVDISGQVRCHSL
jgi:hypothetical protein